MQVFHPASKYRDFILLTREGFGSIYIRKSAIVAVQPSEDGRLSDYVLSCGITYALDCDIKRAMDVLVWGY
jgi:hypothetical protein